TLDGTSLRRFCLAACLCTALSHSPASIAQAALRVAGYMSSTLPATRTGSRCLLPAVLDARRLAQSPYSDWSGAGRWLSHRQPRLRHPLMAVVLLLLLPFLPAVAPLVAQRHDVRSLLSL